MAKGLHGGVWLELKKHPACDRPVEVLPAPGRMYLPLMQHIGDPASPCVSVGEYVRLGQRVATAGKGISCALHSPVSGIVSAIVTYTSPHGEKCPMIVIENDRRDAVSDERRETQTASLSPQKILTVAKEAAITSVSGPGAPLWWKLSELSKNKCRTLVLNAVEAEPYQCSSQKLIDETPEELAGGMALAMKCTGAEKAVLAVCDDVRTELISGLITAAHLQGVEFRIEKVYQKYPSGLEHYLGHLLFGSEEMAHAGYMYAEECIALYRAARYGFPQISRVVTVAGDAVDNPQNIEVRIGTPIKALLDHCGLIYDPERVVVGGLMRGTAITNLSEPVTKGTTSVLAMIPGKRSGLKPMCINCGKCVSACPERLLPNYIAMRAVLADFQACSTLHIEKCVECGACAYVCPGHLPIVELIKNIKKAALTGGNSLE